MEKDMKDSQTARQAVRLKVEDWIKYAMVSSLVALFHLKKSLYLSHGSPNRTHTQ